MSEEMFYQEDRIIYIEDFENENVVKYIKEITVLKKLSKREITIKIIADGGSIYSGFALYDFLELSIKEGYPIHTFATGAAQSMAFVLFLVGDRRTCSPRATFMNHKGFGVATGTDDQLTLEAEEQTRIEKMCNIIIAKRTGYKDHKWWNEQLKDGNQYYDKKKAKEMGILT